MIDLGQIKEYLDLGQALITPLVGLVLAFYGWKKTGEIDLRKTIDLGIDVVRVFRLALDKGDTEEKALDAAVAEAERLRKKTLSTKLANKLKARILTIHNETR